MKPAIPLITIAICLALRAGFALGATEASALSVPVSPQNGATVNSSDRARVSSKGRYSFGEARAAGLKNLLVPVRGGYSGSGGGTGCTNPQVNEGRMVLLDFALHAPALVEAPSDEKLRNDSGRSLEWVAIETTQAYALAHERISRWNARYKGVAHQVENAVGLLRSSLQLLRVAAYQGDFGNLYRVSLPAGSVCQERDLRTIALYVNGIVVISLPAWNKLGIYSRAGVLVHEALRREQIDGVLGGGDAELQELTAKIMFGDPGADESPENDPFFEMYWKGMEKVARAKEKACSQLKRTAQEIGRARIIGKTLIERAAEMCRSRLPEDWIPFFSLVEETRQQLREEYKLQSRLREKDLVFAAQYEVTDLSSLLVRFRMSSESKQTLLYYGQKTEEVLRETEKAMEFLEGARSRQR